MNLQKQATQKNYDEIADLYTKDFGNDQEHFDTYLKLLIKTLNGRALKQPIVDLGSGPGNVIDYLLSQNVSNSLIAVDFTQRFCDQLRSKYKNHTQVNVIQGDFIDYVSGLSPESTSAFIANYSIIHVPDEEVDQFFTNIRSALQQGGLLAFSVWEGEKKGMEPEPYQVQGDTRLEVQERLESYLNNFTIDELNERLTKTGFSIIKIDRYEPTMLPGEFPQAKIWVLAQK